MSIDQENRNDDAACGKLWEIYVKEAQQYDEGMIRSWKEDMDNMLVFSGLYSAILTAFVIESYQNLQPDLAENSTALLQRISEQLASSSALTPIPDPLSFNPTAAALTCNILWFISLAMALTCSFLATLVQQWSRRFLHRTSTVRSPGAHAHLLQFLYFGLKDLRMHAIVDLIPSLLHLSLFAFFAGLIAFLHDVNYILTWISTAALSLVLLMYIVLTVLPLFKLDSPYATPLSSLLWRLLQAWRRIFVLTPIPSIHLFHRLASIGNPHSHPHSTDEEAQREPHNDTRTVEGEGKAVRSSLVVEWNIIDATVKASRIRRVEHECRSIVWSLRSLNDDSELLPFVEALPDAVQYEETENIFRVTNFHLLEALVASIDPQVNIIHRILDLMDNALNPWHTKVHKERCAIGCARALYALGHIVHANRARFRPMTHNTPLFTTEIINRIGQGFCHGALDMAYGQSALVICALSSCLWIKDRLTLEFDSSSDFASIVEPLLAIKRIDWRYSIWDNITVDYADSDKASESDHVDPTDTQSIVDSAIAHLLSQYAIQGIENHPQHFEYLTQLITVENTERLVPHFPCEKVFWKLKQRLDSYKLEETQDTDREKVDAILRVAIRLSGLGEALSTLDKTIRECIASYHRAFGWGVPSSLGDMDIQPRLFECLKLRDNYPRPLDEEYLTCLQHLLVHTGRGEDEIHLFWAEIYQDIHRAQRKKSSQELSLAFMITLKAAESGWLRYQTEELLQLMDRIYEDVSKEKLYPNASRNHLHWITLLQCLASQLPISHVSDVLKFFHAQMLNLPKSWEVSNNVPFLTLFTRYSEAYYLKLINCLKSELEQLLEINAMIWTVWDTLVYGITRIETPEECQAWDDVFALLRAVEGAITPEMRQVTQTILVQPRSSKNPNAAILHRYHSYDEDKKKCLDLPTNVEATKEYFTQNRHLFTTLPEVDMEEDRLLAMDDDTYANYIHRDRIAAHCFVRLPPSDDEEEAALQPPLGDPSYIHSDSAPDSSSTAG